MDKCTRTHVKQKILTPFSLFIAFVFPAKAPNIVESVAFFVWLSEAPLLFVNNHGIYEGPRSESTHAVSTINFWWFCK